MDWVLHGVKTGSKAPLGMGEGAPKCTVIGVRLVLSGHIRQHIYQSGKEIHWESIGWERDPIGKALGLCKNRVIGLKGCIRGCTML